MRAVEIEFRPVGFPKFARANEQQRSEAKSAGNRECTPVAVDGSQQLTNLLRICDGE